MKNNALMLVSLVMLFCCCDGRQEKQNTITVSILPQKYFVQKIAGDKFEINVLVPPGYNPVTYTLSTRQMMAVSHSRVYFRIGHVPFEKVWIKKIASTNPNLKIVDTSKGISLITGSCDCDTENHERGVDPHLWLSPKAVKIQVRNMCDWLKAADPVNEKFYRENCRDFLAEIDVLDKKIKNALNGVKKRKIFVYHPAWAYFARDYNLEQISIERGGKELSSGEVEKWCKTAREENIKIIFMQKQFSSHEAKTIAAEIGCKVVELDPLALDWTANLEKVAVAFKKSLEK